MSGKNISDSTMRRLPYYLHYLNAAKAQRTTVSATNIAQALGLNDVQVRKDLAAVSGGGRPKTGYVTDELIENIGNCLGCGAPQNAAIVGVGNLGRALLSYEGFADYGLHIAAAFDADSKLAGQSVHGVTVQPLAAMPALCRQLDIKLGIITVPVAAAQQVCRLLAKCNVTAIWNFAPVILTPPAGVTVENENLASSLAVLSRHMATQKGAQQ